MAQAESIITAIREVMSRDLPKKSTCPVRAAYTELVAALAGNPPHRIYPELSSDDLDARADHLEKVFAALSIYISAVLDDTAQNIPSGTLDRLYLGNLFSDLAGDAVGAIRNAADEMRNYENWRAS
jgi:hypothetical protein